MTNIKNFTGGVNINADITPITREKIETVSPETWHEMNISHLWEQRIILNNRVQLASMAGHAEIAKQVQAGIAKIDVLLQIREAEKSESIEKTPKPGESR